MRVREYYRDPSAPRAHDLLPAAFAAVRNTHGEILVVRRIDDGYWELPGGRVEVGETADGVETDAARWSNSTALAGLPMHPAMRLRLDHAVAAPDRVHHD